MTKILLVDDQLSNLLALEAILAGLGPRLVRATSGIDALRALLDDEFAVILMDVQMPTMDGFETASLIRERERTRQTPIIFLTAYERNDVQMFKGYSLGAVDYLYKPIVPEILRSKVMVFVDLFQKTRQISEQSEQLRAGQQLQHERAMAEERQRWEMHRLREEASREKKIAHALTQKAEELAHTITERELAEKQLRARVRQQAIIATIGQRALAGLELPVLLQESVEIAAQTLDVDLGRLLERRDGEALFVVRAAHGWDLDLTRLAPSGDESFTLAAHSLRTGEPVIIENLEAEPRFPPAPLLVDHQVKSGLSVLVYGVDGPIGALEVFSRRSRRFTADDVYFLQALANVLAAAIQRKESERELGVVRDELAVQLADMTRLHELSARLSNHRELPAVSAEVVDAMCSLQGTGQGMLVLLDREHGEVRLAASQGFAAEMVGAMGSLAVAIHQHIASGPCPGGEMIEELADLAGSAWGTPLLTRTGDRVGTVVTFFAEPHRPSDREFRLVELYVRQAAAYIENARLYREIQDADRRKDEFLAMLGHELRNPLAPMLNALHLLRLPGAGGEEIRPTLQIVERQVKHLARLVDDLLDVSRISSGKIQLRKGPVELAAAVNSAIDTARPLIETRNHELRVALPDAPKVVEADEARLAQVIANLLNNSAKYTEPGGRIELEVACENEELVLLVRDNGIGIAPELLPYVFDLFTQADRSLDRSQGGLGIGLTLVRRLVEMHGGTASAMSPGLGQGSTFRIRLPVGAPLAPRATSNGCAPRQMIPICSKRVLVVEDNKDGAQMLARLLRVWGHQVAVAHDGPSAIELARSQQPHVILLDIGLPGMSGYEVAHHLKDEGGMEQTLLVALTGYGQHEDQRQSREVGFDKHLVKPVDPDTLKTLLETEVQPEPYLAESPSSQG